jgi:hypothetical protein
MKRTLTIAAMITLGAAAWTPLPSMAQPGYAVNLVINSAPPPPRFESVPAPRRGYVWAPGYWNWDGGRHIWLSGHWEPERTGYRYRAHEWVRENGGYRLRDSGWYRVAQARQDEIRVALPAPRYERIPRPRHGYVWQPGYWDWQGDRYDWTAGFWVAERPGYLYSQVNYAQRNGRWYIEPSRWIARGSADRDDDGIPDRYEQRRDRDGVPDRYEQGADRDRDGVPDRYERDGRNDQDRDGIPDSRDTDRDGDGVQNERDANPDNPVRR